jgi:hypothetical protein
MSFGRSDRRTEHRQSIHGNLQAAATRRQKRPSRVTDAKDGRAKNSGCDLETFICRGLAVLEIKEQHCNVTPRASHGVTQRQAPERRSVAVATTKTTSDEINGEVRRQSRVFHRHSAIEHFHTPHRKLSLMLNIFLRAN